MVMQQHNEFSDVLSSADFKDDEKRRSFTPKQIAEEVTKHIPDFVMSYNSDFRQKIADSWPQSINDSYAKNDWGWKLKYDLKRMTSDMMEHLKNQYKITV